MSLNIEDLKPQPFTITVKGVELNCLPLKLSQTLSIASVGSIFSDLKSATPENIKGAEKQITEVINEVIPDLKGHEVDGNVMMEIVTQLMLATVPSDSKYLKEAGVELNADPKAEKSG